MEQHQSTLADEIRINQTVQITAATPFLIFGNLFALIAMMGAAQTTIFSSYAIIPIGVMIALLVPMILSYRRLRYLPRPTQVSIRRIHSIEVHSLLLGLCWMAALVLLFPALDSHQHIWVVTSTFFLAFGSAPSVSSIPRAAAAFSLPMMFTSWFYSHWSGSYEVIVVMAYHFGAITAFAKVLKDNWILFRDGVVQSMEHTKNLNERIRAEREIRRREAEAATKDRERQDDVTEAQRRLIDAIPFPLVITRQDGILPIGKQAAQLFGIKSEEMAEHTLGEFFVDASQQDVMLDQLEQDNKIDEFEVQLKGIDGYEFWTVVSSRPLKYEGEDCFLNSIVLIDQRKRAEAELAETEALLRTALDSMDSGLLMYSSDLDVELINDRLLEILDIPPTLMRMGKSADAAMRFCADRGDFGPGNPTEIVQLRQAQLKTIEHGFREERIRPERITETHWSRTQGGSLVSVTSDITERKRAEQELEAAKVRAERLAQARAELVATVSHEVRTPMNGVLGMAQLMRDMDLNTESRECVEIIYSSGNSLLRIVDDLLDIAKLDAEGLELEHIPFRVVDIVTETIRLMDNRAEEKGIELAASLDPDIPPVIIGDPLRLRQILLNLVSNAIKFTDAGSVTIAAVARSAEGDNTVLEFAVIDTGKGISLEAQEKLFTAYTQESVETARKYGGTGLGLAICRRLVDLMGGKIELDSEPDMGSVFRFRATFGTGSEADVENIPDELRNEGDRTLSPFPPMRALSVLHVEDNVINRQVVGRMLARAGHQVMDVNDGRDALDALQVQKFDLILMDRHMPNMSGLEATMRIRQLPSPLCDVPILGITASAIESELNACLDSGMNEVLTKPVNRRALLTAMERLTGGRIEVPVLWSEKSILVADDVENNRALAKKQMERLGIACQFAVDGQEALEMAVDNRFDAVLVDFNMPRKNGLEFVSALRELEPALGYRTPVIAMTGDVEPGTRRRFLDAGMDDYLSKPVDFEQLSIVLGRCFGLDPISVAPAEEEENTLTAEKFPLHPVLDLKPMREAFGTIDEGAIGMLDLYRTMAQEYLSNLATAIENSEVAEASQIAHAAAGASKNAGAKEIGTLFSIVEVALKEGDIDTARDSAAELPAVWDRVEAALDGLSED